MLVYGSDRKFGFCRKLVCFQRNLELIMENEIIFFEKQGLKIEVKLQNETIWTTQKGMAELFDVNVPAISKHLKNIFNEGELDEKVVVSILEITTPHGALKNKTLNFIIWMQLFLLVIELILRKQLSFANGQQKF